MKRYDEMSGAELLTEVRRFPPTVRTAAEEHLERYIDEALSLHEWKAKAKAVLALVQWASIDGLVCYCCGHGRGVGHADDCPLAALLAAAVSDPGLPRRS
jgi:hypothetical protein